MFSTVEEERNYRFYEDWTSYWLPIYKKQVFKAKFWNDKEWLNAIKDNVLKNWNLELEMKKYILEKLGLKYLLNE